MELGTWPHLIRRFFFVLAAGPLTDEERLEVESWLDRPGEVELYWQQPVADQRHGMEAARRIAAVRSDRRDLVRAALLHDVGKRWSNLAPLSGAWIVGSR
jgi:predicted HD phosphohydrolase